VNTYLLTSRINFRFFVILTQHSLVHSCIPKVKVSAFLNHSVVSHLLIARQVHPAPEAGKVDGEKDCLMAFDELQQRKVIPRSHYAGEAFRVTVQWWGIEVELDHSLCVSKSTLEKAAESLLDGVTTTNVGTILVPSLKRYLCDANNLALLISHNHNQCGVSLSSSWARLGAWNVLSR
jgi:hypothetical protein